MVGGVMSGTSALESVHTLSHRSLVEGWLLQETRGCEFPTTSVLLCALVGRESLLAKRHRCWHLEVKPPCTEMGCGRSVDTVTAMHGPGLRQHTVLAQN